MQFSTVKSVFEYLENIPKFQSSGSEAANFDLSRFEQFCASIGNPQQELSAIHVGGTNGKGSTCHLLGSIYQSAGYNVGIYTSPHILNFNERFRIDDGFISDDELLAFFQQHADRLESHRLTYFEISTAIAFWWFERSEVDIAIIEVGLGGRLDATNVIDPAVSVITSIALDHTDILGDTIETIATEKAGIIKPNRPVVMGDLPVSARTVIRQVATDREAPLNTIDQLEPRFLEPGEYQLTIEGEKIPISTNLATPVQAKNIAMAWRVVECLNGKFPVSWQQFLDGLKHVNMGVGRFERLIQSRRWYFDGGHNPEAVRALKESVKTVGQPSDATLVLSMMRDKIQREVMNEFSEFKNIYYYALGLERAASFDDIKQWLPQVNPFPVSDHQTSFPDDFDSELVIFAGSFYFYETVRDWVSSIA